MMLNIENYYERLVVEQLLAMARTAKPALSQAFLEDVACLALNHLPSCYMRNLVDMGSHLTEADALKMQQAVTQAIAQAVERVRQRPHDQREN